MSAPTIDDNGCIRINIAEMLAAMTGEDRAQIIQSLACCTQVIDEVMNQVIDGSTSIGWCGPKGWGGNPDAVSGIDGARMRIAKASSQIAALQIERLKAAIQSERELCQKGWDAYYAATSRSIGRPA